MADELELITSLIERLLCDPALRARFRRNPGEALTENGLGGLAADLPPGHRALRTLELRESRSSLAGVMVAAAAEGVDFAHVAEHAAPALEHQARADIERLARSFEGHHHHAAERPAGREVDLPALASPAPQPHHAPAAAQPQGAAQPAGGAPPAAAGQPVAPHAAPGQAADPAVTAVEHHHHRLAYPGNDASPQQIARWMALHAKRAGLPPELPIMAALTESGMRNLPYGDRDSVGFFQMRLSVWDHGEYAGYVKHPGLQLKWFIDHALAARAADPGVAGSPSSWGEWIAAVERPAVQFRGRYQLHLDTARELLRGVDLAGAAAPRSTVGAGALQVAMRYLGTPYQWGGSSPATGFDCSGLVQYAYSQEGIQLPRVAADQFNVGVPVPRADLRPGDAVFFAENGYVHHVGLYIGDGRFVNAPQTGEDVKVSSLSNPYFAAQYAGARRYTAALASNPSNYARSLPTVTP